jgi:hypothetical protein
MPRRSYLHYFKLQSIEVLLSCCAVLWTLYTLCGEAEPMTLQLAANHRLCRIMCTAGQYILQRDEEITGLVTFFPSDRFSYIIHFPYWTMGVWNMGVTVSMTSRHTGVRYEMQVVEQTIATKF